MISDSFGEKQGDVREKMIKLMGQKAFERDEKGLQKAIDLNTLKVDQKLNILNQKTEPKEVKTRKSVLSSVDEEAELI